MANAHLSSTEIQQTNHASKHLRSIKSSALVSLMGIIAFLAGTPAFAQTNFCGLELVLSNVDFTNSGGKTARLMQPSFTRG